MFVLVTIIMLEAIRLAKPEKYMGFVWKNKKGMIFKNVIYSDADFFFETWGRCKIIWLMPK